MRKFKRLIQKTAIALAVGTAGIASTAIPIASSAVSVQAADLIASYEAKAKEFEKWADDKGYEIELVDLGEYEVYSQEELEEQIQNFIDAYDDAMREDADDVAYLYILELTHFGNSYTRTISIEDEDGNKLKDDIVQQGESGYADIYHIDGTSLTKENISSGIDWEEYVVEFIDGYEVKSYDNIGKKTPTQDETGKVIYKKTSNPVETINENDDFDTALEKMKAYAESKGKEPKEVKLEDVQVGTDENGNPEEQVLNEYIKEAVLKMKEAIDKNEDPVIATRTISWLFVKDPFRRIFEIVNEDGNTITDAGIQDSPYQEAGAESVSGSTILTTEGEKGISGATSGEPEWEEMTPPEVDGYEFVRGENMEAKKATKDETGKLIYKKKDSSTKTDKPSEVFAIKDDDSYETALLKMKAYADSKDKEPTTESSESTEVSTDEYGNPDSNSIKNYEKELVQKMKEVIDKGEDPKIVTGHISWYNEKAYYRTFEVVDEDGKTITDDIQDSPIQSAIISKTGGSEDFTTEGAFAKSYNDFNESPEWDEMLPFELEGYEFVSGENTEAKEAVKDETGKLIYKKKSNDSKSGTVKTIKRTTRFIFEGDSNPPTIDDIVDTVDYEKVSADQTASIGLKPSQIHFDAVDIPKIDGWKVKSTKNTDAINGLDSYDDIEAEVVYVKDRDDSDIEKMSLLDIIKEIKNSDIKLNETKVNPETGKASEKDTKEKEYKDYYADVLKKLRDAVDNGDTSFDVEWKTFRGVAEETSTDVTRTISFEFQNDSSMKREPITQTNTFTFSDNDVIIDTEKGLIGEDTSESTLVVYPKVNAPNIEGWELVSSENTDEIKVEYKATDDKDKTTSKVNKEGKFVYKKIPTNPDTPTNPNTPSNPDTPTNPDTPIDIPEEKDPITVTANNASQFGLSVNDFRKTFVRNIQFVLDNGARAADPVNQSITLERTALYNPNTGEITYSNWNEGSFGAVTVPVIAGYTPNVDYIAETPVDVNTEVLDEIITYYQSDEIVDNLGEIISEAIIDDSYITPVEFLDEYPESGYETDYIGDVPDTGNPGMIGGIIGAVASGIGMTGASLRRRKKHED